jgi:hypothetical protein
VPELEVDVYHQGVNAETTPRRPAAKQATVVSLRQVLGDHIGGRRGRDVATGRAALRPESGIVVGLTLAPVA